MELGRLYENWIGVSCIYGSKENVFVALREKKESL